MPPLPELQLKISGRNASRKLLGLLAVVEIHANRGRPASFRMRLEHETQETLLEAVDDIVGNALRIGTTIEILHVSPRSTISILQGEVESIGLDVASGERGGRPAITIAGFDMGYRLTVETKSRVFSAMSGADVAALIAEENGLRSRTDSSAEVLQLHQSGQTDWDFLTVLADRSGFDLFVVGNELRFQEAGKRSRTKLTWGRGLTTFAPTISGSRQTVDVTVRGWNPDTKETVEGIGSAGSGRRSGGRVLAIGDQVVRSTEEASRLAQSVADAVARGGRSGRGALSPGKPLVMPGATVDIAGLGEAFSGSYYVDAVTHSFTPLGYSTTFELGGRPDLLQECGCGGGASIKPVSSAIGVVIDNHDPLEQARVRVALPWLGDAVTSSWARIAAPMAGPDRGTLFVPEVGDEVLVAFEHGDLSAPYILGALWNGVDRPPAGDASGANNVRLIRSRSGHVLRFDDGPNGSVEITSAGGHLIHLDEGTGQIMVAAGSAGPSLQLDAGTGALHLAAPAKLSIESGGDMTLKAGGHLTLEAGANISAGAAAVASMEGAAGAELTSGGVVKVAGAVVTIN